MADGCRFKIEAGRIRYKAIMLTALTAITIEFDGNAETLEMEDVIKYDGEKDLAQVRSLEGIANTSEMTLSFLGEFFPGLQKLRLNNSVIPSIRDISTSLSKLRFLSLAHCGLSSLDGLSTLSDQLEEVYLAFNHISDVSELIGMSKLTVLDLEENEIESVEDCGLLACCSGLMALTLAGNPAAESETYREDVMKAIPHLRYLDEKRLRPRKPKPVQVVFEPIEPQKVDKNAEKCTTKPKSSSDSRRDNTITEYIEDMAEERPPTACGTRSDAKREIMGSWLTKPKQKLVTKPIVTPKIARPVSSCMKRSKA